MKYNKIIKLILCIFLFNLSFSNVYCFNSIDECDKEIAKIKENIKTTNTNISECKNEIADLKEQIKQHTKQIENYNTQINLCNENISLLQKEIEESKIKIEQRKDNLFNQLKLQQHSRNTNIFLSLLVSSNSISSLTNNYNVMQKISMQEKKNLEEIKTLKERLVILEQEQKRKLEEIENSKIEIEKLTSEKQKKKEELTNKVISQENELNSLSSSEEEIARQRKILANPPKINRQPVMEKNPTMPINNGKWHLPVDKGATITARFMSPTYFMEMGRQHRGTDIALYKGANIYSIADGVVIKVSNREGPFGRIVAIVHDVDGVKYVSLYAHLSAILTQEGMVVKGGTLIGSMGGSGFTDCSYPPHLHLEIAKRDYFTTNVSVRSETNFEVLNVIPWKGNYREASDAW